MPDAQTVWDGITNDQIDAFLEDLPDCPRCKGQGVTYRPAGHRNLDPVSDLEETACRRCGGTGGFYHPTTVRSILTNRIMREGTEPPWA